MTILELFENLKSHAPKDEISDRVLTAIGMQLINLPKDKVVTAELKSELISAACKEVDSLKYEELLQWLNESEAPVDYIQLSWTNGTLSNDRLALFKLLRGGLYEYVKEMVL